MIYACMGCDHRHVGCHSECEKFLQEAERANSLKELVYKSRRTEDGLIRSKVDAHDRFMKRRHRAACGW